MRSLVKSSGMAVRALALAAAALVAAIPGTAQAQENTVAGQVVDATNARPLAGAQVSVPGTQVGALADANGRFRFEVPEATVTIRVDLIGYRSETITVDAGTLDLRIPLSPQAVALDQIVVTGTPGGTQRRAVGNDVVRITASEVRESQPVTDVQGTMRGQATGVYIPAATGSVGAGQHMRMRGLSSISLSSYPLIYVDGVRVSNSRGGSTAANRDPAPSLRLNDFSPDDIESIEIIKGPAAATLYGTEASAGVIQIITKRGTSGAPVFEASVEAGGQWLRNAEERLNWNYQINPTTGELTEWHPIISPQDSPHAFQTGPLHTVNLGVSGGTDRVRYHVSGMRGYEEGYVDFSNQSRNSLRGNIDVVLRDDLDLSFSSGTVSNNTRLPTAMNPYGYPGSWHWGHALRTQNDGHYVLRPEQERAIVNRSRVSRNTWSLTLSHNPREWLRHRVIFGEDRANEIAELYLERQPLGALTPGFGGRGLGEKTSDNIESVYLSAEYAATVSLNLSANYTSATSAGFQYYKNSRESLRAFGQEFAAPGLLTNDALARTTSSGTYVENASLGFYVQQEIGWRNRAFLTTAVRMDDNSAFGSEFDAAIYPKVSATWVLSEEEWWPLYSLNSFRVRGAFGKAGRQPDLFAATSLYQPVLGANNLPGVRGGPVGNPELGPEVGEELEIGFDAGLFEDRVSVTFNFYSQNTRDALMQVPVSLASGFFTNRWENIGLITNRGIELQVDAGVLEAPNYRWNMGFSLTTNRNRLMDLGGVPPTTGQSRLVEGKPIGTYYGVKPVSARWVAEQPTWQAGRGWTRVDEFMCELADGTVADCTRYNPELHRVSYGKNADPNWFGSVTSTVTLFNNLRLFAQATYEGGHVAWGCRIGCSFGFFRIITDVTGDPGRNIPPNPVYAWYADNLGSTTEFGSLYDASHVRLQTVSAAYTLPQSWTGRVGASNATLQIAANNVGFLWRAQETSGPDGFRTTRKIVDPISGNLEGSETTTAQSSLMAYYPSTKVTASLRLRF